MPAEADVPVEAVVEPVTVPDTEPLTPPTLFVTPYEPEPVTVANERPEAAAEPEPEPVERLYASDEPAVVTTPVIDSEPLIRVSQFGAMFERAVPPTVRAVVADCVFVAYDSEVPPAPDEFAVADEPEVTTFEPEPLTETEPLPVFVGPVETQVPVVQANAPAERTASAAARMVFFKLNSFSLDRSHH